MKKSHVHVRMWDFFYTFAATKVLNYDWYF